MRNSNRYIKNAKSQINKGGALTNAPADFATKQRAYMAERTRFFMQKRAYLSCDYVNADVQGIGSDFYDYVNTNIRLSDIVNESPTSKKKDDYKNILFPDVHIDYFPIGAKVKTMGNTWIAINPANMSDASCGGVIARCNASYNSYDFYGNVITEPIVVEKYSMLGNDSENTRNLVLMDGYYNVTCQKNEITDQLGQNKRIILGSMPYHITGFSDFIQEFTGDRDSTHIIHFTARIDEPNENDDTTINFIANGKSYSFAVEIFGAQEMTVGTTVSLEGFFIKDGQIVYADDKHPIDFIWESSDESIVIIDENGIAMPVSEGNAVVRAKLAQNLSLIAEMDISVKESITGNVVVFDGFVPVSVNQYEKAEISASYYQDGQRTEDPLTWSFVGAEGCYSYIVSEDGRTVMVECLKPSETPLVVIASHNGESVSAPLLLEGY